MTRPTADKARQALFNILEHAAWSPGLAGSRVIDLFAGSGTLGLEAVSRGAASCLLIDSDPAATAAIAANIAGLRLEACCTVRRLDARRLPAATAAPFDLALLDPPYGKTLAEPALAGLAGNGWLAPGALAVVERGADESDFAPADHEILDSRVWGAARVWFLRYAPATGNLP